MTVQALPTTCPSCGFDLAAPAPPPPVLALELPAYATEPYAVPLAAPPAPPRRHGLATASAPQVLLGLGALCLVVAAVIFLAVAWSWLGLGGRTAVLLGLTAASLLGGDWCARKPLPLAAEALVTVGLALVGLDVMGAAAAGWLGSPSALGLVVAVGSALMATALLLCVPAERLVVPQLVTPLGLALLVLAGAADSGRAELSAGGAVVVFALLLAVGRVLRAPVLAAVAGAGSALGWLTLGLAGLGDALADMSLHGLWFEGNGWGLVAAAVVPPLAVSLLARTSRPLRVAAGAFAAAVLTLVVALPGLDEGVARITVVALVATLVWAVAAAATPPAWVAVPRVPLLGAAATLAGTALLIGAPAVRALLGVDAPFSVSAAVRLAPGPALAPSYLLPLAVIGLVAAALVALPRSAAELSGSGASLGLTVVVTLALHPVPLWSVVALLALTAGGLLAAAQTQGGPRGSGQAAAATLLGSAAVGLALPSAVLTAVVLAGVVVAAVTTLARGRFAGALAGASFVLPVALTGLAWSVGELSGVDWLYRSLVVLVVVGLLTVQRPRIETEAAGWLAITVTAWLGLTRASDPDLALTVQLTVAGAILTASAISHADRRLLGWAGGALLAVATWIRLAEAGVHVPEPYTLPTAAVLLWFGLRRLNHDDAAGTMTALGAALTLATVPSLVWVLDDPVSLRALLLGGAGLVLVVAGAQLWWHAPLVVGTAVGVVVVLRELAPYTALAPQWVVIGLAGTLLMGVGVTWESRLRDLQRSVGYLGRLR